MKHGEKYFEDACKQLSERNCAALPSRAAWWKFRREVVVQLMRVCLIRRTRDSQNVLNHCNCQPSVLLSCTACCPGTNVKKHTHMLRLSSAAHESSFLVLVQLVIYHNIFERTRHASTILFMSFVRTPEKIEAFAPWQQLSAGDNDLQPKETSPGKGPTGAPPLSSWNSQKLHIIS